MANVNRLKGKIVEQETSVEELASKIGLNKATLYRKLNSNGDTILIREAKAIAKELHLSNEEIMAIFFPCFVAEMRQNVIRQ